MATKKIERFTGANSKRKFASVTDFYRHMASGLWSFDECDGRGCTVCISADALIEAADTLDKLKRKAR